MILRMIVSAINPYKKKGVFRNKSFLLRCQNGLFSFCIKCMQNFYRRYAYHDCINLGDVRIVQTCRDEEFEGWLKAIGKDVKPHLEPCKTSTSVPYASYMSQPFYSFFHFERQLTACQNGKVLTINHSPRLFVNSEIMGTFRKSDSRDILIRTEFKSLPNKVSIESSVKEPDVPKAQQQQTTTRHKVSLGKPSAPPVIKTEPIVQEDPPVKQMRGVEIDESF